MDISFYSNPNSNKVITTKLFTWHDHCAVVGSWHVQKFVAVKRSFHRIWIASKNCYWNGPQAQAVCNVKLSTFIIRSRPKLNYGAGRDFGVGPEFGATRKQPTIPGNSRARWSAGEEDQGTWLDFGPGWFHIFFLNNKPQSACFQQQIFSKLD